MQALKLFGKRKINNDESGAEYGVTGLKQRDGVLAEEFLRELRGLQGRKIYAEMRDNDPTVGALLSAIELMLRAVPWRCVPSAQDVDGTHAAWVQRMIERMSIPWHETLSEMCGAQQS